MNEIAILHISDLHFRIKKSQPNKTFFQDVQRKLIHAVKSRPAECGDPDFVTITGDIAFSSKEEEYGKALAFFEELRLILPDKTEFLAVPGNHDVDWDTLDKFSPPHYIVKNKLVNQFLEDPRQIKQKINVKFKRFKGFAEQLTPGLYGSKEDYFWVKNFPEKNVSFLGLNSAWACEGNNDQLNIALGYPQIMKALEKSTLHQKVVLMHHPPNNWLKDMAGGKTRVELFKNCHLLLHGHNHVDNAMVLKDPSDSIVCLGANASYTDDKDGSIGFQFIKVRFSKEGGMVDMTVWPYIFNERRNDFAPDTERWKSQEGKPYFIINIGEGPFKEKKTHRPTPHTLSIPAKYKDWVRQFHSKLNMQQPASGTNAIYAHLPDVYIPLETSNPFFKPEDEASVKDRNEKNGLAGRDKNVKEKETPFIDIERLTARKKCILLRGPAGMGKTTLIKHLAYTITLTQGPALLNDYLPVVVYLKKIWPVFQEEIKSNKTGTTFESLMQKYCMTALGDTLNFKDIKHYLSRNKALFLLDGLDEVPVHLRPSLIEVIANFRVQYIDNRFFLTSRPHGIDAAVKEHFGDFLHDISSLEKKQISEHISRWLRAISSHDNDIAEVNAADMIADILSHEPAGLFTRNPLLLTALCVFYMDNDGRIPDQQTDLYDGIVNELLYRRFHDPAEPGYENTVREYLMLLAVSMQTKHAKSIEISEAKDKLKKIYPIVESESLYDYKTRIEERFSQIEPRCGLLEHGSSEDIEFTHLSYQEFLAAQYMLDMEEDYRGFLDDAWWEKTILFYLGLMNLKAMKKRSNGIIHEILTQSTQLRLQLLAARALGDFQPSRRDDEVVYIARKKLTAIIESDADLEARVNAGELLGVLGDLRIKPTPRVDVGEGEFTRGGDKFKWEKPVRKIYLDAFKIAVHPVTNEEFEAFIRENGYNTKDLWTPEGWEWKEKNKISEPLFRHNREWNGPNSPVVGVSWYEAAAYARWVSLKTGETYALPTEAQWEKAARGTHGSPYPWGENFDKNLCNTYENGLNRTSPVGIFPTAKSPYGCFDMAGNVWEWCRDWYKKDYYIESPAINPQGPLSGTLRVIRGGSWYNGDWRCRGAFRDYSEPDSQLNCIGFRLVKSSDNIDNAPPDSSVRPPRETTASDLQRPPSEKFQILENPFKKILILSANPKDTKRLRLDEEFREIDESLRLAKKRDRFEVKLGTALRYKDLRRALLGYEPHIVHFIGHGETDGIKLEDEQGNAVLATSQALSGLFGLCSHHVECVILSSCYSAPQAEAVNEHIHYVIGMLDKILDKAAIKFSVGFYDALGAGRPVEEAFEFGRNALLGAFPALPLHHIPTLKINS